MKRLAAFLIFLLAGSLVPAAVMAEGAVATIHIIAGQSKTAQIPHATVEYHGEFWWDGGEICAPIHVVYDNGGDHGVCARPSGETDPEKLYEFKLENVQFDTWYQVQELEVGDSDAESTFTVDSIDPVLGAVKLYLLQEDRTVTLSVGDSVTAKGVPQATIKLTDINVGLFSTTAKFSVTYKTPTEADIVVYPYQAQEQAPEPTPSENQTNETPTPRMPNLTRVPVALVVVGSNAAGADVAAGAKVAIAVQKMIDNSKTVLDALPWGGVLKDAVTTFLWADAKLDIELQNPDQEALVIYSVGGPAVNQYTAELNSRPDITVRFEKINGRWYLIAKDGRNWTGHYGLIEFIPSTDPLDPTKIKKLDVIVAGLDRYGTYGACKLLQANFLDMAKNGKWDPRLEPILLGQLMALDPTLLWKKGPQPIAIIVDEDGNIVEVITG